MGTCFNCRRPLVAPVGPCPYCGITGISLWSRALGASISPRADGWGFSTRVPRTRRAIVGALLSPLWVALLVALAVPVFGSGLLALAGLGALFIFMPGVLIIANYGSWPRWARFFGCLAYVALSETVYVSTFYAGFQLISRA
jgi:hypothetical protein